MANFFIQQFYYLYLLVWVISMIGKIQVNIMNNIPRTTRTALARAVETSGHAGIIPTFKPLYIGIADFDITKPSAAVKEVKHLVLNILMGRTFHMHPTEHEFDNLKELIQDEDKSNSVMSKINGLKRGIQDPVIRQAIINEVKSKNLYRWYDITNSLDRWNELVEVDNSMHGRSCSIEGDSYKSIKYIKKEDELKKAENERLGFHPYHPVLDEFLETSLGKESENSEVVYLKNALETDSLRNYINKYDASFRFTGLDDYLTTYLYQKYYLSRLSPEVRGICQRIANEFKIKLFVEDEEGTRTVKTIYDELSEWEKAFKHKSYFTTTSTIDINRYNTYYFTEGSNAGGYVSAKLGGSAPMNIRSSDDISEKIRHELLHLNEIRGIKIDYPLFKEELFNAGIDPEYIDYADRKRSELNAVASQGDYSKYSPAFKRFLIKQGVPKEIFKMKPIQSSVKNAQYIDRLRKKYPELDTMQKIMDNKEANEEYNNFRMCGLDLTDIVANEDIPNSEELDELFSNSNKVLA